MSSELQIAIERWLADPAVTTIVLAHVAHTAVVLDTAYAATLEQDAAQLAHRFVALAERHAASIGIVQRYSIAASGAAGVLYQEPLRVAPGLEHGIALGETERSDSDGVKRATMRHLEAQMRMALQVQSQLAGEASKTIERQHRRIAQIEGSLDIALQRQCDLTAAREEMLSQQHRRVLKAEKWAASEARKDDAMGMALDFGRVALAKQTHASTLLDMFLSLPDEVRGQLVAAMTPEQLAAYQALARQALTAQQAADRLVERQQPRALAAPATSPPPDEGVTH